MKINKTNKYNLKGSAEVVHSITTTNKILMTTSIIHADFEKEITVNENFDLLEMLETYIKEEMNAAGFYVTSVKSIGTTEGHIIK